MISVGNVRKIELPGEHVYIGREWTGQGKHYEESPLANPIHFERVCPVCGMHHFDEHKGREQLVECYRTYLRLKWVEGGAVKQELIRLADLSRTMDIVLDCWCAPKACHGDEVKRAIELIVLR